MEEKEFDFCGSSSLGQRGQVVVPKKIRDKMKLKKGDNFLVMKKGPAIVFLPTSSMQNIVDNLNLTIKKFKK